MCVGPVNKTNTVTAEDVMPLLQEAVDECLGKRRRVIRANESIYDYYRLLDCDLFDDIELLELSFNIERLTGVRISNQDWEFLMGWNQSISEEEWKIRYAPIFTFGRLAELVAVRKHMPEIREETILGVPSRSVGAFRAIQEIAKKIKPDIKRFAPSTPILERFRQVGLERFWAEVRVLSSDRVPPLVGGRIARIVNRIEERYLGKTLFLVFLGFGFLVAGTGAQLGLFSGILILVAATIAGFVGMAIVGIIFLVFFAAARASERDISSASNLLPNGIETFGDLARLVSGERGGWCQSCQYDLTGLEEPRCPECGYDVGFRPNRKVIKNGN